MTFLNERILNVCGKLCSLYVFTMTGSSVRNQYIALMCVCCVKSRGVTGVGLDYVSCDCKSLFVIASFCVKSTALNYKLNVYL